MLKRLFPVGAIVLLPWLTGCVSESALMSTADESRPEAALMEKAPGSLFPGDQGVLTDQQIAHIFQTRIEVPGDAKMAVVRYGSWPAWYWSEEFARLDQQSLEGFLTKLKSASKVRSVQVVPQMLMPRQMDVPHLRETAARVQADLVLIYRPSNHSYQKSRFLKHDQTRAYCTVEVAVLDTRTGVITYTARATENYTAEQTKSDMSFEETTARAEQQAIGRALDRVGQDVADFLNSPQKG